MEIDPSTIFFSLPTINGELPQADSRVPAGENDLLLHEDDWRQFEAISLHHLRDLEEELAGVRHILDQHSKAAEDLTIFSKIHVRRRILHPLPSPLDWEKLLAAAGVQEAEIFGVGLQGLGMAADGFSFRVSQLSVFGIRHADHVSTLCLAPTRAPGLREECAQHLAVLLHSSDLILVHWPSATVLAGIQDIANYLKQGESGNS